MSILVSDMPLSFTDDTSQEKIELLRAERMARKKAKDRKKTNKSRLRIIKAKDREKVKSGHSEKPIEYLYTGDGRAGMGFLNEYLNLGGVEVAEPEQEAREAAAVYARFILERAEPPACVKGADEEERRFRFIPFETKFTDDAARGPR